MKPSPILLVGVASMGALGTVWYVTARHKKRAARTSKIFEELTRIFNPSDAGLVAEAAFDIHYHRRVRQQPPYPETITLQEAQRHAQNIHQAWGNWWVGDDEDRIYATFRRFTDKVMVSQVADAYQREYGVNLIEKMKDRLDQEEIGKVLAMVRNLPEYTA